MGASGSSQVHSPATTSPAAAAGSGSPRRQITSVGSCGAAERLLKEEASGTQLLVYGEMSEKQSLEMQQLVQKQTTQLLKQRDQLRRKDPLLADAKVSAS